MQRGRLGAGSAIGVVVWVSLGVALAAPTAAATWEGAAKTTEVRDLGTPHAFVDQPLAGVAGLQRFFETERADLVVALERAGWPGDPELLLAAVARGEVEETEIAVGTELEWMTFRRHGKEVYAVSNVVWKGKAAFKAFLLRVTSGDWRYTFVVPEVCGNLALLATMGTRELTVAVDAGVLELTDPEGKKITIRAGESGRVSAPPVRPEEALERGEAEVPTTLQVTRGEVEFREYGRPISLLVGNGNAVSATMTPDGLTALTVPETNPGALPIKVGDAVGTLSAGAGVAVGWSPPLCALEIAAPDGCAPGRLVVDASGSRDEHGEVVSVAAVVTRPNGTFDELGEPAEAGAFRWTTRAEKPGRYEVTAVAISDTGRRSENECTAVIDVEACLPPPPTCALELEAAVVGPFEELGVDASGSRSDGGTVAAVELVVTDEAGATVAEQELGPPFTGAVTLVNGGVYTVTAVAVDEHGQRSTGVCQRSVRVRSRYTKSESFFAGYLERRLEGEARSRSGSVGGLKASLHYLLRPGRDLELGVGGFVDASRDRMGLFLDAALNWRRRARVLGVGAGVWDPGNSDGLAVDLFAHAGHELDVAWFREPVELFAEARLPVRDFSSIDESWMILGGVRLR